MLLPKVLHIAFLEEGIANHGFLSAGDDLFYVNEVLGLPVSEPWVSQDVLCATLVATLRANSIRRIFLQQAVYKVSEFVRMGDSDLIRKLSWLACDQSLEHALTHAMKG